MKSLFSTWNLFRNRTSRILFLFTTLFLPIFAAAGDVHPLFNLQDPVQSPFPSNRFTASDLAQNTHLRVNLPLPNCNTQPSDCVDTLLLNQLDGFNPQPRLSIPFDGLIDVNTVNSDTVFLVKIDNLSDPDDNFHLPIVGINQIVWDPATLTLHAQSDMHLDEHANYLLIVTTGVHDLTGEPIEAAKNFERLHEDEGQDEDRDSRHGTDSQLGFYREILARLLHKDILRHIAGGLSRHDIAVASLFTTESVTATLQKIHHRVEDSPTPLASFNLGLRGERTVFSLNSLRGILFHQQITTAPTFQTVPMPTPALQVVPGSVAAIAFGKFTASNFETPDGFIPAVPTRTGVPAVQNSQDMYFNLFLPAGQRPAGGWPVAIFGHGFGDNKNNSPLAVASVMAAAGVATITINTVGHGFGALSSLTVIQQNGQIVLLPAGGRSVDQNGDGIIDPIEGFLTAPPRSSLGARDGVQQTVADLMQLVRTIQGGMDVDGSGSVALDPSRIYYFGQSLGGIYGTVFLGIEPDVRAGVLNVPGGPFGEISRLSPTFRPLAGLLLAAHVPSLINIGGIAFDENEPLRNQPPVTNNVPGAMAIQAFFDASEWLAQAGDPVAWAPFIRKAPLTGEHEKSIIVQFARGDKTVPNPTTTAIIRSGDLADRTTLFRNDIAFGLGVGFPSNPHSFLTNLAAPLPVAVAALEAQQQIAVFFATDGSVTIDPDGPGPLFETPIASPLPEDLAFIP